MPPVYTNAQVIGQLNSGAKWLGSQISYGFLQSAPSWDIGYEGNGFSAFTAYQANAARAILTLWDELVTPSFVEATTAQQYANIKLANTTTSIDYAHAYYPGNYAWAGEVWLNAQTYTGLYTPNPGNYYWMTIIHEVGHALGLSHPGPYNGGSPTYANDAVYAQDTHQWTVMSYFSASYTGADWNGGSGWQYAQTPMVHDVLAIQAIYGAATTVRAGNTVYGFNSNAGNSLFDFSQNRSPVLTIYDTGGTDTLDLSGFSQRAIVNLAPGTYSSVGGTTSSMTYNIGIANNTWIENAIGGAGNDTFFGNSLNNLLNGGAGTDTVVFTGSHTQYQVTIIGGGTVTIADGRSGAWDGTDTISNFELFQFADGIFDYNQVTNRAPVATAQVGGVTLNPGETAAASSLFSASDADGDQTIAAYGVWDPAGGGNWQLNGQTVSGRVDASQLANLQYKAGTTGETILFWAYDALWYSAPASVAVTITANALPIATAQVNGVTLQPGATAAASSLFSASDPDGDPITAYGVWDPAGGGHWQLNGQAVSGRVDASQLANLQYLAGATGETILFWAYDAQGYSAPAEVPVTIAGNTLPVATAQVSGVTLQPGATAAASSLFSASDADGNQTITAYGVWDPAGGGHWQLNGQTVSGRVDASQLANLQYQAGTTGETILFWAYDAQGYSAPAEVPVTIAANTLPVATAQVSGVALKPGETAAASSLFSASDPDGDPIAAYGVWDPAGGGSWLLNGQPVSGRVDASQLANLQYQAGATGETILFWAYDAQGYSAPASVPVTIVNNDQVALVGDVPGDPPNSLPFDYYIV